MNPVNENKIGFSNMHENNPIFDIFLNKSDVARKENLSLISPSSNRFKKIENSKFLNISEIKSKEKSILDFKNNNDFTVSALLIQNQIQD
jgi:hypothetical protein